MSDRRHSSRAVVIGQAGRAWLGWIRPAPLRERELQRFIILALLYRLGSLVPNAPLALSSIPTVQRHAGSFIGVVSLVILSNVVLIFLTLRRRSSWFADSVSLRVVDLSLAVVLNLWFSLLIEPGSLFQPYRDPFWIYVVCSVALWTGVRRAPLGIVLVVGSVLLQMVMVLANGVPVSRIDGGLFFARQGWVLEAFVIGVLLVGMAREARAHAEEQGRRAGVEAERARSLRQMHDTVLQTLEGIALRVHGAVADPLATLEEVGAEARRQAAQVRALLKRDLRSQGSLYSEMEALVAEIDGRGTILPRFVPVGPEPVLSPDTRDALVGAVGEALRNSERHADARHVTIYLETAQDQVRVEVRDDGRGFDEATARPDGYGMTQSIRARLAEAGGRATLVTSPGGGTTWELRAPVDEKVP